jgi:hypothetical protein
VPRTACRPQRHQPSELNALHRLLRGTSGNLIVDFSVLVFALVLGLTVAAAILPRLGR